MSRGVLEGCQGLYAALTAVGYTPENLQRIGALPSSANPLAEPLPLWELLARAGGDDAGSRGQGHADPAAAHVGQSGQLATPGRLETLVRLLLLGQAEAESAVRAALSRDADFPDLPRTDVDALVEIGLLERVGEVGGGAGGGMLRAVAGVVPMGGRLILRDLPRAITGADPKPDHVLPVGGASVLVSQLTPRGRVRVAADIGTGQGYQAFGLAEHADRVIGTDVNPRALRLAGLARDLAGGAGGGLSHVEFREGSLFEPLKAEAGALDLIVSNPPFVIAPPQDVVGYSDRGVSGDGLVASLVTGACAMLAPGGWCVLVGNWAYSGEEARDGRWAATPTRWIEAGNARAGGGGGASGVGAGGECDAVILHMGSYAARSYAFKWMEETGTPRERLTPSRMDAWMRYYGELGIEAVAFGAIVLRRRRGGVAGVASLALPPVIRAESVDTPAKHAPCAGTIERTLAGAVWLARADAMGAERLGSWTPRLTRDAVLVREATPDHARDDRAGGEGSGRGVGRGSAAWRTTEIYAVQRGGIPRRVGLDSVAADVLAQLDGTRSVDDAGRRVARSHGLECSGQEAAARARELVRGLAALGYFEPDWLDG